MNRFLAVVLLAVLASRAGAADPAFPDNDRPVRIRLDAHPYEWILVALPSPRSLRLEVRQGPGIHPTLRAKATGEALPRTVTVEGHLGRFCRDFRGSTHLFWSTPDHHGSLRWDGEPRPRSELVAEAVRLEGTLSAHGEHGWAAYARSLPAGSLIEIHLRGSPSVLTLHGGPEGRAAARRAFDLARAELGGGFRAVSGLVGPAFVSTRPPELALMLAGPALLACRGRRPESTLRGLVRVVQRPLPPVPDVPPLGPDLRDGE